MEDLREHVALFCAEHPLSPAHVDCATAVMLKILDGKCKMKPSEKVVMSLLYEAVRERPGERLPLELHMLIARAHAATDDALREQIYERRVLAESMISRPVMKGFKASIRAHGLFTPLQAFLDEVDAAAEDQS